MLSWGLAFSAVPAGAQSAWKEEVTVTASTEPVGAGFTAGARLRYTKRVDGREFTLVDALAGRALGAFSFALDLPNLLDEDYQEIVGVDMPGRSGRVEVAWTTR